MNEIRNIMVGFEFGEKTSQICYYDRKAQDPISIPVKVGTSEYEFPTALCKKPQAEEWHFGIEVKYFTNELGYLPIHDLYSISQSTKSVQVEGKDRQPYELLGEFLKAAIKMLGVANPLEQIGAMMITVSKLSKTMVLNLRKACKYVGFEKGHFSIQDYQESFYYHTFAQRQEIWNRKVGLFHFKQNEVTYEELILHAKKRPMTVTINKGNTITLGQEAIQRDQEFMQFVSEMLGTQIYSSIFITGEGFERVWAIKSIAILCKNHRKVFQGNNLFVKGACYAAKEKFEDQSLKAYLYEGEDLVKINLSMNMIIQGTDAPYSIIKAGVNWYEVDHEFELILDGKEELAFQVQHIDGGQKTCYRMQLPNLPKRPNKTTRLHVRIEFESVHVLWITVKDLGFGDMFPSSQRCWTETLEI